MDIVIKQLQDNKTGVEALFYPVTHEKAVRDSDGITLESKLGGLDSKYNTVSNSVDRLRSENQQFKDTITGEQQTFEESVNKTLEDGISSIQEVQDEYEEEIDSKIDAIRSEWNSVKDNLIVTVQYGSAVSIGRSIPKPNWSWLS